jgi:opacity protein-like surface antigen
MKTRALVVALLLVISATSALAAGPYIGASGGASMVHDSDLSEPVGSGTVEYDTGFGFNVSAGYNFDPVPVRVEFEFGYKTADVDRFEAYGFSLPADGADIRVLSYMVNGFYDIKTKSAFTPYIGAGLGLLNGEFNDNFSSADDTVFGYQLIVGAAYNVNKNLAIDLSYHFQGAAEDFSVNGQDVSYMSSNIMAGLRYNF